GRLSEIIGEEAVYSDQNWKRFELEDKSKLIMDSLSVTDPGLYQYLIAYANGANAYINNEDTKYRDPMYLVWNYTPRAWKPYYSFLIQWYMSFDLTFYDDYINKQEILDKLPESIRAIVYPDRMNGQPLIIPSAKEDQKTTITSSTNMVKLFQPGEHNSYDARQTNPSLGSNNWVLGTSHTSGGQSYLCNDLHLFLTAPNIFYEMQLSAPRMHVYGYSIPGVPMILTGHNEHVAWGITNGGWDVTEQYLLKTDPSHIDQYFLDGKWEKMTIKHFLIQVKGGATKDYVVKYTVFGPVVETATLTYALHWHPGQWTTGVQSFWEMMIATDWNEFREALRLYDYPSQNFAYSDTKGNIGMICAGKMPVKPEGYSGGLLDGTKSPHWQYFSFDSLPQAYNPSRDYLFSANQQPDMNAYYSSRWFSDLYRPRRIDTLLAQDKKFQVSDMQKMQLDVMDMSVKDLQQLLYKYTDPQQLSVNWKSLLTWDGQLVAQKTEAVFYKTFRYATGESSKDIAAMFGVKSPPSFDQFMHLLLNYDSVSYKGKIFVTKDCFLKLVSRVDSLFLMNIANPALNVQAYSFSIPQMTFLPGLDIQVTDMGGSDNTINVNYGAHSVIRTVIETGKNGIQSWMVNAIGQTGRLNEKGYSQQLASWKQNALHKTQFVNGPGSLQAIATKITITKSK
ncbi:MAG: penicillin acylase family protein, partial [Chitinophagaceae bacterium]